MPLVRSLSWRRRANGRPAYGADRIGSWPRAPKVCSATGRARLDHTAGIIAGRQGDGDDGEAGRPRGDTRDRACHGEGGRHYGIFGGKDLARKRIGAAPLAQLQLSNGKAIAVKLRNVVDLCISPPAYAIVLSVDKKSQIPVLDAPSCGNRLSAAGGHHAPRLRAQRHRGAERAGWIGGPETCSATATKSSSASSASSRPNCRPRTPFTPSLTIVRRTSSPGRATLWFATRAGRSTSCPRHAILCNQQECPNNCGCI